MLNLKVSKAALFVIVTTLSTIAFAQQVKMVFLQDIYVQEPILKDRADSGYQFFHRFAKDPDQATQCNLHIVSHSQPFKIPAGTVFTSSEGIHSSDNLVHPIFISFDRSVRVSVELSDDVRVQINCSDRNYIKYFLYDFNVRGINKFTGNLVRLSEN